MGSMPRATHDNERVASRLSEQRLARVRYFLLRLNEDGGPGTTTAPDAARAQTR